MWITMRRVFPAFLALLIGFLLISGVPDFSVVEAQSSSEEALVPFTQIEVNLDDRLFANTLPPNVPFLLRGRISEQVHEVHATYNVFTSHSDFELFFEFAAFKSLSAWEQFYELRSHSDLELSEEFKGQSRGDQFAVFLSKSVPERFKLVTNKSVDEKKWQEKEIRPPWRRSGTLSVTPPTPAVTRFTLLIPALEANRYFHFKFSFRHNLNERTIRNFREQARGIVDGYFQRRGKITESITFEQSNKLRLELIDAILGRQAEDQGTELTPTPKPGSIFDKTADPEVVVSDFTSHLVEIKNPHNEKYPRMRSFEVKQITAAKNLRELINNQTLKTMVENLKADQIAGLLVADLEFMQFSPDDASALADGSQPIQEEEEKEELPSVEDTWKARDLDVRLVRLQRTIDALTDLNRVVSEVHSDQPLQEASRLRPHKLIELDVSIEETIKRIQLVHRELERIQDALKRREDAIDEFIEQWGEQIRADITVFGRSVGIFTTRHK